MWSQLRFVCVSLSELKRTKWMRKWKRERRRRKWMTVDFLLVRSPSCFSLWWLRNNQFLLSSFLICPLSRWAGPPGGCDHHHGRRAYERDQSRGARRSHDWEGVWQNNAVSSSTLRLSKSQALSGRNSNMLSHHFISSLIGCSICRRRLPGTTVSAHASWDVWGPDCPQGCEGGWTRDDVSRKITCAQN